MRREAAIRSGTHLNIPDRYLRLIYELIEEGIAPRQVRIVERTGATAPTVGETVARMERAGLLATMLDKRIELTPAGHARAVSVMRKHRVSECFLHHTVRLEWEALHAEADRWQHVISDVAERAILRSLGFPSVSPFGIPIPGIDALMGGPAPGPVSALCGTRLDAFATDGGGRATVRMIAEGLQVRAADLVELCAAGIRPGYPISVQPRESEGSTVCAGAGGGSRPIGVAVAKAIFVEPWR